MHGPQFEILKNLKRCYLETHGEAEFQIKEHGPSVSARQFYLTRLEDNLVRPLNKQHRAEYSNGNGSELDDKMKALRSSSAMTFNVLGNEQLKPLALASLFKSDTYRISYEYQMPTLKRGLPANLDAMLTGSSGDVIACEMKMLEWLTSTPTALKDKYLDETNYRFLEGANIFSTIARKLNGAHITRYDYAQMFKHTLALYSACEAGKVSSHAITLANCVWEVPARYHLSHTSRTWIAKATAEEHAGFSDFCRLMQPVTERFHVTLGIDFEFRYIQISELISALSYPVSELKLLHRYL